MNVVLECTNKPCRFRCPSIEDESTVHFCPKCGEEAIVVERIEPRSVPPSEYYQTSLGFELIPVMDNIRSAYNVGSIIRTCEGLGVKHLTLCGITPTPLSGKVNKTALGASDSVKWEYQNNCVDFIKNIKSLGHHIIALENTRGAKNIFDIKRSDVSEKSALVIGNEKTGVEPGILKISDSIMSIPLVGKKESLNVAVAAGIAIFHLISLFRT